MTAEPLTALSLVLLFDRGLGGGAVGARRCFRTGVLNWRLWVLVPKPSVGEMKWSSPEAGLAPTSGFKEH